MMAPKVVRDGKIAVLYSPGYGAGWFSWNRGHPQCLTDPCIVALVEAGRTPGDELCKELFGEDFYAGGADQLEIEWVDEGDQVMIDEYDGSETLRIRSCDDDWITV